MTEAGEIRGHQRVAAFLLSLEESVAANILKNLKDDVVHEVARAMIELDPRLADARAVAGLYRELALQVNGPRGVRARDEDGLERLLTGTFGRDRGDRVLQEIRARRLRDRPFLELERHPPARIASVLAKESPAVVAAVLAHIDPALSALVLRSFDQRAALEAIKRMATLVAPPHGVLRSIAAGLVERAEAEAEQKSGDQDRLGTLAELLNRAPSEIEKSVVEILARENAEMAAELRERMFTWEDLATIDKRSMQKILGTVDTRTLSVALKACSAGVEENVLRNLSARVRDMVAEERDLAGAVPMSVVNGARLEIMQSVRAMIDAGEFQPSRGGEELVT